ncbi:MAG: UDP-glucose/GDP-mannose dehydrogenase family protein [Akkermansia sp.]
MNLTIIGSGYVGLTTGTCFAEKGHHVICVDNNLEKVQSLSEGNIPIYEPELEDLILKNTAAGRLTFSSSLKESIEHAEVIFIAVPTPPLEDGAVDLSFMHTVALEIAGALDPNHPYCVIVDKSTVPVKTSQKVDEIIREHAPASVEFDVVSNPEFLREGSAVHDLLNPDRIVIGANSQRAMDVMRRVYKSFYAPTLETDVASAELIKHAANSFLALKISYINAIAKICDATGANVDLVAEGIGMDKRISEHFLNAGIGYGGSCFPKDIKAFIQISETLGEPFNLLKEVEKINEKQLDIFLKNTEKILHGTQGKKIAIWGLAFKSNTDDIRESVAIKMCKALSKSGATLTAYDPKAQKNAAIALRNYSDITYCDDMYACTQGADALIIATEWPIFANANLSKVKAAMKTPVIFDGRNIMDPENMSMAGFEYHSVGRPPVE